MAEPKARGRTLPRSLVIASYALGVILLTLFFVYRGFPYDLLVARFSQPLEASTSTHVRIGDVLPHVSLLGPGIEMRDIRTSREGGQSFVVDRIFVRPAWSLSWLTLTPALHLDLTSALGSAKGTITLGADGGFEGQVRGVQVGSLPVSTWLASLDVDGTLDATIDLQRRGEESGGGLTGDVRFDLLDGSVAGPAFPIALPFKSLGGDLRFGEEGVLVSTDNVALDGPVLAATIEGRIGESSVAGKQPLEVDVTYEVRDEAIAAMLGGRRGGPARLEVGGTLESPVVR